jgi:lipopolysaccharide/colanic/teichoic acid biosynthesis glycosyltransferase/nucleoside-diphosphate-sugar epimerase
MLTARQFCIKRCLDIAIALPVVLLTWPLCLILVIAATIDTRRWGLFRQTRVGRFGLPFQLYKIRTMAAEQAGHAVTVAGDHRVTKFGRIVRWWNLDELPQFWHVLTGSMSLVGPRPDVTGYADELRGKDRLILRVRPGITGPSSIRWRHEEALLASVDDPIAVNRETIWPDKVRCNLEYLLEWSPWLDLRLLAATVLPGVIRIQWDTVQDMESMLGTGRDRTNHTSEIVIPHLLGRKPISVMEPLLHRNIREKVVLVTGAGGSIGSELCRQIIALQPKRLVLLERCEHALYQIDRELTDQLQLTRHAVTRLPIVPVLGCAGNRYTLDRLFSTWSIDTVYHAAAHKHVPLVEINTVEGVANNTLTTWNAALAAERGNVSAFVLVSTDKAVRPTSVMGASKRLSEIVLQALMKRKVRSGATRFSSVRFGNVLGSSGSVVPLFQEQIQRGGPVTVTHPDVTRFLMTVEEAVQLVIQAGSIARGGEVHVLDMGKPVRILDLAHQMIELSGHAVMDKRSGTGSIDITFIGLRGGEKLHEELIIGNNIEGTVHPRIMQATEPSPPWERVENWLSTLERACATGDCPAIRAILNEAVEGYQPESEILDVMWRQPEHHADATNESTTVASRS